MLSYPGLSLRGCFLCCCPCGGAFFLSSPGRILWRVFFFVAVVAGARVFFCCRARGAGVHSLTGFLGSQHTDIKNQHKYSKKRVPLKCLEGDQSPCLMRFDTPSQEALSLQQQQ